MSSKTLATILVYRQRWCGSAIAASSARRNYARTITTDEAISRPLTISKKRFVMPTAEQCVALAEEIWKRVEEEEEEDRIKALSKPIEPPSSALASKPSPFRKRFVIGRSHNGAFVVAKQLVSLSTGSFKEPDWMDGRGIGAHQGAVGEEINHYQSASDLIQYFLHERTMCASSTRAITATFALVERLLREMIYTKTLRKKMHYLFQDDQDFHKLMNYWKNAALAEEPVLLAIEMLKKVKWFISVVPDHELLRVDKRILLMFMQVMAKQSTKRQAPQVIESLLEFAQNAMEETNTTYMAPDIAIYELLLKSWAESGSPHTNKKLEEVLMDMGVRDIPLSANCYSTLIRYWTGQGNLVKAKSFLGLMQAKGLEPDIKCYGHMLHGFTRLPQPSPALGYLDSMFQISTGTPEDIAIITTGVLQVLDAFHRRILEDEDVRRNLMRAEDVLRKFESRIVVPYGADGRVFCAMMNIYASAGRAEDAESMMKQMDPNDPMKYTLLVRAYGKMGRADLANEVVFSRMPNDPKITPAPHVYKELILAWAESKQDDAMKQAYSVIMSIDESEYCKQHNIRPDSSMFVALLDCVGASRCQNPGFQVLAILDEIELRSREDSELQFNQEIYDASLNVCLQGKRHLKSVEEILKRIEKSDYVPHMSFYNDVLNWLSSLRCIEAAECAERTLLSLRELSKSNAQLKPNASNYNAVISSWIAVDDTSSSKRAWTIYEKMEHDSVLPTMKTFTIVIGYFAKSMWGRVDVSRADRLLNLMESGEITGVLPDRRHYGPVMNGWIALGDLEKATDILFRLIKAYISSTGSMKQELLPTPHNIYALASRWIAVDELSKATEFVEQMQALYDKGQLPVCPDIFTYLELNSAWSQSESPDATEQIEKLDATMRRIHPVGRKNRKPKRREKKPV